MNGTWPFLFQSLVCSPSYSSHWLTHNFLGFHNRNVPTEGIYIFSLSLFLTKFCRILHSVVCFSIHTISQNVLCNCNFYKKNSFAEQTFRCSFQNGLPHFIHVLPLSVLRLGSFYTWLTTLYELKFDPLLVNFAMLVNLWWLKSPFSSMSAWPKTSEGLIIADNNFRWLSLFFMLQMNASLIHPASADYLILHELERSGNALQNYWKNSLFLFFLLKSLCLSSVIFGGLLKNRFKRSQISIKEMKKVFTLWFFFWANTLFPSMPKAKIEIDRIFLSASDLLSPLILKKKIFIDPLLFGGIVHFVLGLQYGIFRHCFFCLTKITTSNCALNCCKNWCLYVFGIKKRNYEFRKFHVNLTVTQKLLAHLLCRGFRN